MNPQKKSESTDQKWKEEAQKNKPSPLLDAFLIGFLAGIILFSLLASTWGFLTLIPLFLIYGILKKNEKKKTPNQE